MAKRIALLLAAGAASVSAAAAQYPGNEVPDAQWIVTSASLTSGEQETDYSRLLLSVDRLGGDAYGDDDAGAAPEWMVGDPETHLAIGGYDPVSYFDEGAPKLGDARYEAEYHGAVFRFASEDHYRMFLANPDRYAPALGGYDAEAFIAGAYKQADPLDWAIVDGKLYLGLHRQAPAIARRDEPVMVRLAEEKWRAVDAHYRSSFFQAHRRDYRDCTGEGLSALALGCALTASFGVN